MRTGFTLMELIVVIFIVSLIAGIFVSIYYTVTNSKLAEYTREEMDDIESALLDFYRDIGQFPKDTNNVAVDFLDLERKPSTSDRFYGTSALKTWRLNHWAGPYIQDKFGDDNYTRDAWGNYYIYNYTYGNNYCTVTSYGPDGASGGGDDIVYTISAVEIDDEKEDNVQDELDVIQKAVTDYFQATGDNPSSIEDLFEWEVLNMHMDESSWSGGTESVIDSSGMGNNGTPYLGANTTSGLVGRAGSFLGIQDRVIIDDASSLDIQNELTIECWIQITVNHSNSWCTMIRKNNAYGLEWGDAGTNRPAFIIWKGGGGSVRLDGSAVSLNEWHYLAATYDGSEMRLYIDGNLDNTLSTSGQIATSSATLNLGAWVLEWYRGLIDELKIYRLALPEDEILRHYENPGYPRSYFDLHDYTYKYDEWETEYQFRTATVSGTTYRFFYSCGPDREDDSGKDDDILPRGLEWLRSSL
ncbi:MAG: hypothetical protein DRP73_04560 [Candidatus Omnitrophota bacterium]|nr:MAG: hypothetical protein DRP73_04560 [Candidatus Omnitrophota bacterium]